MISRVVMLNGYGYLHGTNPHDGSEVLVFDGDVLRVETGPEVGGSPTVLVYLSSAQRVGSLGFVQIVGTVAQWMDENARAESVERMMS